MDKYLRALKWMIFRKRHVYLVHYLTIDKDEHGVEHVTERALTLVTTINPRKMTFNTMRAVLRKEDNNDTIEIETYNYQGKW